MLFIRCTHSNISFYIRDSRGVGAFLVRGKTWGRHFVFVVGGSPYLGKILPSCQSGDAVLGEICKARRLKQEIENDNKLR